MGLGFRPGPETHVLDTLGVQIPRCEDLTRTRKDRAYAFEARLSSLDDPEVCVAEGRLLGHKIGRNGSAPDEERCQAVVDFLPLREKLHIQQFLGCANWLRGYLPAEYGHAAKVLGQWQKPGAVFPEGGLGSAASEVPSKR